MNRLTFKEPSGKWGVVGMNADNKEEKAYGCICKLLAYEETGLEPAEIEELICEASNIKQIKTVSDLLSEKSDTVHIGTEVHGYVIKGISENHCIAERINKVKCDDFVVWSIDNDRKGVSIGRYFNDFAEALSKFSELMFIYSNKKRGE